VAVVGAVCAALLIRPRDFRDQEGSEPAAAGTAAGREATEPVR
jgi:hypothetical protein